MLNDRIKLILKDDEASRSDDKRLLLGVWETYGFVLSESQRRKFMELPSGESIRRNRQRLQELGFYKANDYVRRQRKFKSMQVQQMIPKTKPENVDRLIQKPMFNLPKERNEFRQI